MAELEMNYEKEEGEDISLNIQRLIEQQIQTRNDHRQFSPSICYLNKQLEGCNRSYKETAITTGVYDSALSSIPDQEWSEDNYNLRVVSDSHFRTYISLRQVKQDLILLHSHIPFFILRDIFNCTVKKINPNASLIELVLSFFKEINPFEPNPYTDDDDYGTVTNYFDTSIKHILDLLYKYHRPAHISLDPLSTVTATYLTIDLAKAGVHFKPNKKTEVTIKFNSSWTNCTLTMPVLYIEEHTELLLLNLTCYERCFPEVGNYMASYLYALMMLVDSKEDLLKLVESKIITNQSGHQHIVNLIHEFAIEFVPVQFIYSIHWRAMGDYYNKFAGYTRRTYFSGAWSYIASATALILFIFTAVQTYCSIRNL
ncbi:UPF0481 protein At3g47200-like [Rutidosis leptorrhynchoides]|uniref:UPF0481 protein At3g47200-like n=1 Tax=Rutidosis leptorrhynchoides TaxID=125765 RepID=UPI003A99FDC5